MAIIQWNNWSATELAPKGQVLAPNDYYKKVLKLPDRINIGMFRKIYAGFQVPEIDFYSLKGSWEIRLNKLELKPPVEVFIPEMYNPNFQLGCAVFLWDFENFSQLYPTAPKEYTYLLLPIKKNNLRILQQRKIIELEDRNLHGALVVELIIADFDYLKNQRESAQQFTAPQLMKYRNLLKAEKEKLIYSERDITIEIGNLLMSDFNQISRYYFHLMEGYFILDQQKSLQYETDFFSLEIDFNFK